jgi:hypothetical protein
MSNFRWDPYFLASCSAAEVLMKDHFQSERKLLFILGKGFDIRMNFALKRLLEICPGISIECWLICFNEGEDSSSHKYAPYVQKNVDEFKTIIGGNHYEEKFINLWKEEGSRKRRIGDREAASILNSYEDVKRFTDIIVDISALPRGVYFSLIGKILHIIDSKPNNSESINFVVAAAENARIDASIKENTIDTEGKFLVGFMGGVKSQAEREESLIWLPIMGEDKESHITVAHADLEPTEVCPIFPFPAKDPRRPDALLIKYHRLLFDSLKVEPQNIMYVPEQNPFEAYKILVKTVRNYNNSLQILRGCRAALSTFSSKLLSIGTLMAAYQVNIVDNQDIIGVMNVDARGYEIENINEWEEFNKASELFLIWLTGNPYEL